MQGKRHNESQEDYLESIYVDEKLSGGSIIPSWIVYGCLNFLENLILAF